MAGNRYPISGSRRGFTLVELLIVVGVIGLLVGLLMPALNKAREASSRTVCMSNLHEIYLGLQMYAHDNRGRMIPKFDLKSLTLTPTDIASGIHLNVPGDGIQTVLKPYCGLQVFRCPSDSGDATSLVTVFERRGTSYNINGADPTSTDSNKIKFNLRHWRDFGGDLFKPWDSDDPANVQAKIAAGQHGPTKWHKAFYNLLMGDGRVETITSKLQEQSMERH